MGIYSRYFNGIMRFRCKEVNIIVYLFSFSFLADSGFVRRRRGLLILPVPGEMRLVSRLMEGV